MSDFNPLAAGAARQVNIYGNNEGIINFGIADVVPTLDEMLALCSVEAPIGRLPEAIHGRDGELDRLRTPHGPSSSRIQVFCGLGGVGKTTVALAEALRAKEQGTVIFWIRAESSESVSDGMRQVALMTGVSALQASHTWEKGGRPSADLVWKSLSTFDRPWLLIFDDADDLDALCCQGSSLRDCTGWVRPPVGNSTGVIVTTRDSDSRSWSQKAAEVSLLKPLARDASINMLCTSAPQSGDRQAASLLADRLGDLPLALHLAASHLSAAQDDPLTEAQTFGEYVAALDASPLLLDESLDGLRGDLSSDDQRARHAVAKTWTLSIELLRKQGVINSDVILNLYSCFAPGVPLPKSLVDPSKVVNLPIWGKEFPTSTVKTTIAGLRRFGLMEVSSTPDGPMYQIHRLVAEIVDSNSRLEPGRYRDFWISAISLLFQATPYRENPRDPSSWPSWHGLIHHWLSVVDRFSMWKTMKTSALSDILAAASVAVAYLQFRGDYQTAISFSDRIHEIAEEDELPAWVILNIRRQRIIAVKEMGDLIAAEDELKTLVQLCSAHLGGADTTTLAIRYEHASVTTRRGKFAEAEREYDEIIRSETALFGADAVTTLRSRHARAICVRCQGRFEEAANEGERIFDGLRKALGDSHPDVLEAKHEFAISLREQGDFRQAEQVLREVLEVERGVLGYDHPSTLITRESLATTLLLQGDEKFAESEYREILDVRNRVLGQDHPQTVESRYVLAVFETKRGDIDAESAASVFSNLLEANKDHLVGDHPIVLGMMGSRAAALRSMGELIESESDYRSVLSASMTRHGETNPTTLNARMEWAESLGYLGRTDEALVELNQVFVDMTTTLGSSHRNVASVQAAIGMLLLQKGELFDSEVTLREVLDALPESDSLRSSLMHNLVAVYGQQGRLREAIEQLREMAEDRTSRFGLGHPDTLDVLNTLGVCLKEFGHYDEAEAAYRKALAAAADNHSVEQPLVLTIRHNLAVLMRVIGKLEDAERENAAVLEVQTRTHGPEHSVTLATRKSLARVLEDQGLVAEAEAEYRAIREIYSRTVGIDHPHTLHVQGNLAFSLSAQGRFVEAEAEYRDALPRCQRILGEDHPETLRMNHNLAMALVDTRQLGERRIRLEDVLERRIRTLGASHSETLTTHQNLAVTFKRSGNPEEAAKHFDALAIGVSENSGVQHETVWEARFHKAQSLWEAGEPRLAVRELEDLLSSDGPANCNIEGVRRLLEFIRADAEWQGT
ncbi:FxSxx-COOH system tetratricopeptide repeat protein [Nocardia sp. CA-128927]|uniref:FxSxx-COOH system tetratricopeptide repeat protein n=1 Tax=Nocardia sp. CA-128927 TaxID=3239975 RepID=UPI003D987C38